MKSEYDVWVVLTKGTLPLDKFIVKGDLREALAFSIRKMRNMGSRVTETRNLLAFMGLPSMLVYDPAFPVAVIIRGAQLTDAKGNPLSSEDSRTGLIPLVPHIEE